MKVTVFLKELDDDSIGVVFSSNKMFIESLKDEIGKIYLDSQYQYIGVHEIPDSFLRKLKQKLHYENTWEIPN